MPKVLSKPEYSAAGGYNGFPLRSSIQFSSALGQLIPVWFHYLQPGDKVKCSSQLKTRTMPLNAPAMVDIEEHVDWFFVPMQQMFKLFEQVFYGVDDIHSDMFDSASVSHEYPYFTLKQLVAELFSSRFLEGDESTGVLRNKGDLFGNSMLANAFRLLESLGYDIDPVMQGLYNYTKETDDGFTPSDEFSGVFDVARSLWALAAYQRIYYSHYRLSDRENNKPSAYNFDSYYDASFGGNTRLFDLVQLHYRPIQKDFFHNGYVSPLIGQQNIGMLPNWNDGNYSFDSSFFRNWLSDSYSDMQDFDGNGVTLSPSSVSFGNFNLSNLRQSFALEKLLEITRRAGKHVDAQTLAHFGVKMPQGIADEAYFLGSHDSKIEIGDVISTAGTESDPLGQLAGKGYNYSKKFDCEFEAKTHGVLMAIHSSDIRLHYSPKLCDRLNTMVSPQDFFHPEFDNLGMQPIFRYQGLAQYDIYAQTHNNNSLMDWTYPYQELKLKYDRTTGAVASSMKMWTSQRTGFVSTGARTTLNDYLVNPGFLNDIMLVPYSTSFDVEYKDEDGDLQVMEDYRSTIYDQDPFIHDLFIDVSLASKMSTFGLPSL